MPSTFVNIPYLSELNLSNNQIWELPEDFGRLRYSLKILNVSGWIRNQGLSYPIVNFLVDFSYPLPKSPYFTRFRTLVFGNKIEKLPEAIGSLICCEEMDFSKNQIFELPDWVWSNIFFRNCIRAFFPAKTHATLSFSGWTSLWQPSRLWLAQARR